VKIDKDWMSYDKLDKKIFRAMVSAEDARFMTHSGFDWRAIKAARRIMKEWKEKEKGASTISMQTAKNTFLWHAEITCAKASKPISQCLSKQFGVRKESWSLCECD